MVVALFVVGILVLPASIWAWVVNCEFANGEPPSYWRNTWRFRRLVGLVLGAPSIFIAYPIDGTDGQRYTVYGIPFAACAFDENGLDYVGPITMPMFVLNALAWTLFPHLPLFVLGCLHRRNRA